MTPNLAVSPAPTFRDSGIKFDHDPFNGLLLVVVVAVGKRERNAVYKAAVKR